MDSLEMRTTHTKPVPPVLIFLSPAAAAPPAVVMHKYRAEFAYNTALYVPPRFLFDTSRGPLSSVADPGRFGPDPDQSQDLMTFGPGS
jgi:hypothetical protein